jgi:hypothetical protein
MAVHGWLRRARGHFGISAPRVAVRTQMPWWGAAGVAALAAIVLAALWWWTYDARDVAAGFNRHAIDTRVTALETALAASVREVTALRARSSALESELAIARGAHDALARQANDLSAENGALKERAAFLEQLGGGAPRPPQVATRR